MDRHAMEAGNVRREYHRKRQYGDECFELRAKINGIEGDLALMGVKRVRVTALRATVCGTEDSELFNVNKKTLERYLERLQDFKRREATGTENAGSKK